MYELALVCLILRIAGQVVAGRVVSTIYLDMEVSRQVAPDALDLTWGCVSRQSENLVKSKLRINLVSAVIICEECGVDTPIDDNLIFACATCNSTRYHMKTGEEFILTEMDVSQLAPHEPARKKPETMLD